MEYYVDERYYKSDITSRIIKCAKEVHKELGNGFQEVIYQRALEIEMKNNELKFEREKSMTIFYKECKIGTRRADFLVDSDIMVELKALIKIEDAHLAQIINYLEAYHVRIGLLINFGEKNLLIKRFIK